jgi:hypothetical protein
MKKIIYTFSISAILFITGCIGPEDVIVPNHFDRSPAPYNLSGIADTTETGTAYVNLNWQVSSTNNIRYFELYKRRIRENTYQRISTPSVTTFTDSTITVNDTLLYFVRTVANDLFISAHSDTIRIQFN